MYKLILPIGIVLIGWSIYGLTRYAQVEGLIASIIGIVVGLLFIAYPKIMRRFYGSKKVH